MKDFTTFYSCKITTILVNEQILCQIFCGLYSGLAPAVYGCIGGCRRVYECMRAFRPRRDIVVNDRAVAREISQINKKFCLIYVIKLLAVSN